MPAGQAAGGYAVRKLVDTTPKNQHRVAQATAVGAATGSVAGMGTGALAGGAGGTMATFGLHLLQGGSVPDAFATAVAEGLSFAAMGATSGALTGAVSGGREGYRLGHGG